MGHGGSGDYSVRIFTQVVHSYTVRDEQEHDGTSYSMHRSERKSSHVAHLESRSVVQRPIFVDGSEHPPKID